MSPMDPILTVCQIIDQATATWTRTLRTAFLFVALAMVPAALAALIALVR